MARDKQKVEVGKGCLAKCREPCSISREHSDAAGHECALRSLLLSSTVCSTPLIVTAQGDKTYGNQMAPALKKKTAQMSGTVLPHYFTCSDSPLCCMSC